MTRKYKPGYSPEELSRQPIEATCGRCGNPSLLIFRDGAACRTCSPIEAEARLTIAQDRWRVRQGWMPMAETR